MNHRILTLHALAAAARSLTLTARGGSGDDPVTPTPPPPPPVAGSFTLDVTLDKAVVLQGGASTLRATVQRSDGFAEAAQVALQGLPDGVVAAPATIAASATQADIVLTAQSTAPHSLPTAVTVTGNAASATASRGMTVTVRGRPGTVDITFGGGVVGQPVDIGEDMANAVAVQPDGKIILADASTPPTGTWVSLMHFERDGSVDITFGSAGKVITAIGSGRNDSATAFAVQPDGRIVVAGASQQATTGLDFAVARYRDNGQLDVAFGTNGKAVVDFRGDTDRAWALLLRADGKIVVGGEANTGSTLTGADFALLRVNSDGSIDNTFGDNGRVLTPPKSNAGTDVVRALAWQTVDVEARILAVGGEGDFQAARYRPNGGLDASFGSGSRIVGLFNASIGSARAVTVLPSGEAVVAGHINHQVAAVQLARNGALDERFGNAGRVKQPLGRNWNVATALGRQTDGKLILGGAGLTAEPDPAATLQHCA